MIRLMYICYFYMIKKNQGFKSIPISIVPGMNVNQIFYSDVSNTRVLEKFTGTITSLVCTY